MTLRQFARRTVLNRIEHMCLRRHQAILQRRIQEDRVALKRVERLFRLRVKADTWKEPAA